MNTSALLKKPIFKKAKPPKKIDSEVLQMLRFEKDYEMRRSVFFKLALPEEQLLVFINTVMLWRNSQNENSVELRDFVISPIQKNGKKYYLIWLHTTSQKYLSAIQHQFKGCSVEIPRDLKGRKSLDALVEQFGVGYHDYFQPCLKGPRCMEDETLRDLARHYNIPFDDEEEVGISDEYQKYEDIQSKPKDFDKMIEDLNILE